MGDLLKELAAVLNRYSVENGSDTPDFILAAYLSDCLEAWNRSVTAREAWYGRDMRQLSSLSMGEPSAPTAVDPVGGHGTEGPRA
jgi:hypothetical protein